MGETKTRTIVKTVTWRFVATVITAILVYRFTGDFRIALGIGSVDIFLKMFFYYANERVWDKVSWGKH